MTEKFGGFVTEPDQTDLLLLRSILTWKEDLVKAKRYFSPLPAVEVNQRSSICPWSFNAKTENSLSIVLDQLRNSGTIALGLVPRISPVHHAKKREGGHTQIHSFAAVLLLPFIPKIKSMSTFT